MSRLRRALAWPRYGIGYPAYLRLRRLPRGRPARAPLFGRELQILDPIDFLSGVDQIFGQEVYAFAAGPAPRIIDCGANIGLSCIYFRRRFPAARLTAFEPDPQAAAALRANLAAFGLGDVELVQAAAWTEAATLPFARAGSLGGRIDPDGGEGVPAVRLRDWLAEPVDLLKLDIEGAESAVLADCADRLPNVARLFVEYHGPAGAPQTLHRVLGLLDAAGFRCYLREEYAPARPFLARPARAGFDLQLAIYALRERER